MGCGRVGSALAHTLDEAGHSVAVIDQETSSFRKLHSTFSGTTITGIGFDRDRLREAGIERAGAFAAVTSGDNSNILAARIAKETFQIGSVVARIYDPRRAEIYQRLGIATVATVAVIITIDVVVIIAEFFIMVAVNVVVVIGIIFITIAVDAVVVVVACE